jgi:hypothetical protein
MDDRSASQAEVDSGRLSRRARLRRALQQALDGERGEDRRISPLCYPGLRSFSPEEGEVFLGRADSCTDIQQKLAERRTLIVIGGSGSGKSSLVRAGLLPFLNSTRRIEGRDGRWFYAECRPGDSDPMASLWSALERTLNRHFPKRHGRPPAQAEPHGSRREHAEQNADRLDQVVTELDGLDTRFRRGRSGPANLLLLIDQFEEVFRPTVNASLREELLDLLVVCHTRIERAAAADDPIAPGLFLVLTMRSEELHRCTEHAPLPDRPQFGVTATLDDVGDSVVVRSLTDVVNSSSYLLRLLDMREDRKDLREAAVEPARKVLTDYEIPFDLETDEPFAPGVIDWLLDGAGEIGGGMEHQADQMPLLQHALRQMWLTALLETDASLAGQERISAEPKTPGVPPTGVNPDQAESEKLLIHRRHLFAGSSAPGDSTTQALAKKAESAEKADVRRCLEDKARRTEALAETSVKEAIGRDLKEAPLKAMCRALARRDDRGNWARRYASVASIDAFLKCDEAAGNCGDVDRMKAIEATTKVFVREGLLHRSSDSGLFDISHEALIRNWNKCREWLRPLVNLGVALSDSVRRLGPGKEPIQTKRADYLVSSQLADELAPLAKKKPTVPQVWAAEELVDLLSSGDARSEWGLTATPDEADKRMQEAQRVLSEILALRDRAERNRRYFSAGVGAAVIAALLGLLGTYVYRTDAELEKAQEAAAEVSIQKQAKALTAGTVLNHVFSLQAPGGGAIGYPETARELLYDLQRLQDQKGELGIELAKDDPSSRSLTTDASRGWESSVRRLLGYAPLNGEYFRDEFVQKAKGRYISAHCALLSDERSVPKYPATLHMADGDHQVNLVLSRSQQGIAIVVEPVGADGSNFAAGAGQPQTGVQTVSAGSRVCLSDDAQTIVWVQNQDHPAPYEQPEDLIQGADLAWHYQEDGKLHAFLQPWEPFYQPLSPAAVTREIPCIQSFIRPDEKGMSGFAYFTDNSLACRNSGGEEKLMLRYAGLHHFIPDLAPHKSAKKIACEPIADDKWINLAPNHLVQTTCSMGSGAVTLNFFRQPATAYVAITTAASGESLLPILLPLDPNHPPKNISVADGFLTLGDDEGNVYSLSLGIDEEEEMLNSIKFPTRGERIPSRSCKATMPQCLDPHENWRKPE